VRLDHLLSVGFRLSGRSILLVCWSPALPARRAAAPVSTGELSPELEASIVAHETAGSLPESANVFSDKNVNTARVPCPPTARARHAGEPPRLTGGLSSLPAPLVR